jgi:hypothetical protein
VTDLPVAGLLPGWQAALTGLSLLLGLAAAVAAIVGLAREQRLRRHYAALMTGADGADLAAALERLAHRAADAEHRLAAVEGHGQAVERQLRTAIRHVGVLRYSAFHDSGGDQSFVVALLDDAADGVVFSSLVSRSGVRVFAKPVAGGRSSYPLTTEEERVIADAKAAAPVG